MQVINSADAQQVPASSLHGLRQQLCRGNARVREIHYQETKVCSVPQVEVSFEQDELEPPRTATEAHPEIPPVHPLPHCKCV